MVRTTLNLDPSILAELKRRSKRLHRPLGDVASEELARAFRQAAEGTPWPPPGWISRDLGESAVPIDDIEAVWEFLDGESAGIDP